MTSLVRGWANEDRKNKERFLVLGLAYETRPCTYCWGSGYEPKVPEAYACTECGGSGHQEDADRRQMELDRYC